MFKVMKWIICEYLCQFLNTVNLLSSDQFGLRHGNTADDQLLLTYNSVTSWLNNAYFLDVVFFDLAKACDIVYHSVVLAKLRLLGVGVQVLSWICDFLIDRSMWVWLGVSEALPDMSSEKIKIIQYCQVYGPACKKLYYLEARLPLVEHFDLFMWNKRR